MTPCPIICVEGAQAHTLARPNASRPHLPPSKVGAGVASRAAECPIPITFRVTHSREKRYEVQRYGCCRCSDAARWQHQPSRRRCFAARRRGARADAAQPVPAGSVFPTAAPQTQPVSSSSAAQVRACRRAHVSEAAESMRVLMLHGRAVSCMSPAQLPRVRQAKIDAQRGAARAAKMPLMRLAAAEFSSVPARSKPIAHCLRKSDAPGAHVFPRQDDRVAADVAMMLLPSSAPLHAYDNREQRQLQQRAAATRRDASPTDAAGTSR